MNLPTEATPEVIASVYRDAYALGRKGITIYRSGNLAQQVLQLGVGDETYAQEFASKCDPSQCKLSRSFADTSCGPHCMALIHQRTLVRLRVVLGKSAHTEKEQ